jgi:hypothetical protein
MMFTRCVTESTCKTFVSQGVHTGGSAQSLSMCTEVTSGRPSFCVARHSPLAGFSTSPMRFHLQY